MGFPLTRRVGVTCRPTVCTLEELKKPLTFNRREGLDTVTFYVTINSRPRYLVTGYRHETSPLQRGRFIYFINYIIPFNDTQRICFISRFFSHKWFTVIVYNYTKQSKIRANIHMLNTHLVRIPFPGNCLTMPEIP